MVYPFSFPVGAPASPRQSVLVMTVRLGVQAADIGHFFVKCRTPSHNGRESVCCTVSGIRQPPVEKLGEAGFKFLNFAET
jgi:hypothetical protein